MHNCQYIELFNTSLPMRQGRRCTPVCNKVNIGASDFVIFYLFFCRIQKTLCVSRPSSLNPSFPVQLPGFHEMGGWGGRIPPSSWSPHPSEPRHENLLFGFLYHHFSIWIGSSQSAKKSGLIPP